MKSKLKNLVGIVGISALSLVTFVRADDVSCDGTLVPQVCRIFANSGGFTVSGILTIVFSVVIAALVIFILFQIVKAVFQWIGKSGDDKARAEAIKSITNAIIAGIVLLVSVLVVIIGAAVLDIPTPAPQFACYKIGTVQDNSLYLTPRGSLKSTAPNNPREIADVQAVEGTGNNNYWVKNAGTNTVEDDVKSTLRKIRCKYTGGNNAGKEHEDYIVVSRGGLKKP